MRARVMRYYAACRVSRGLTVEELTEGAQRSTMDEPAVRTIAVDRVLVLTRGIPHSPDYLSAAEDQQCQPTRPDA
jgi:hypothetical protein